MDEEKVKESEAIEGQKCGKCGGKAEGEKCVACVDYKPLGGATSFAEADVYDEAAKVEGHIREQEFSFQQITNNIFASEDLSLPEKLAKVKAAATELEARLEKPADKGLLERVKDKLGLGDKATKTEDGKAFPAGDYAYVPDATKPSTWKLRLTSTPGGGPDARIVGAAVAALGKGFRGQKVQIPAADLAAVKAKVRSAWKKANPDKKPADVPAVIKEAVGAFTAFKDALGNWRWLTLTSNDMRDRDGEIIPAEAHEDYVAYADRTKDMPEFRLWHVPGSRAGVADCIEFAHGFVLHSGTFDKGMEDVAASLAVFEEPLGVSHGFFHGKDVDSDTYPWYRDFEVSVLPLEKAANPWTQFSAETIKEEEIMALSDEKRAFLVEHMGEARVAKLEAELEGKEEALKSGDIDFKEVLVETFKAEEVAEAEPKPEAKEEPADDPIAKLTTLAEAQAVQLKEIIEAQVTQAEAIKALQADDDTKIAAAMSPERKPPVDGERPSESDGNEVDPKDKGIDPAEAFDPDDLPDSPGGKALKQIFGVK